MVNHPNRGGAWQEGQFYDRGDGSIGYVSYSRRHPGIARVRVRFYAKGRGQDQTYYLDEGDLRYSWVRDGGESFDALKAALVEQKARAAGQRAAAAYLAGSSLG